MRAAVSLAVQSIRNECDQQRRLIRERLERGATGSQTASAISEMVDTALLRLWEDVLTGVSQEVRQVLAERSALVAVGGSGRGEQAPFSDLDLLFLYAPLAGQPFIDAAGAVVRSCWDAGLKLSHSVRTVEDAIAMAKADNPFATSLVDTRILWGSESLHNRLKSRFGREVVAARRFRFAQDCIASRRKEQEENGATGQQLEPDVKRSLGALRDLHLIRWLTFARYGDSGIDVLRLRGGISREDAAKLVEAHEFLTWIRIHLHDAAGRSQDTLNRDEQLRLAGIRKIEPSPGQRPVERFMQIYFQRVSAVSEIAKRLSFDGIRRSWQDRLRNFLLTRRIEDVYRVSADWVDVPRRHRQQVLATHESILRLFRVASGYQVRLSPGLAEAIRQRVPQLPVSIAPDAFRIFLDVLRRPGQVATTIRLMYEAGLLEVLIPQMKHVRCLMQFNQYHSYTVDEHTLRAVEAAERFQTDTTSLGSTYREISHKEILFLALILHDIGKGFEEDHSELGRRIADEVGIRFGLPRHQCEMLSFLVHKHLVMADLAFRRDTQDPEVLLNFTRQCGSPEAVKMLYVLTAADISAVGPGVWSEWKGELLTGLFERSTQWLSGKQSMFDEPVRLQRVHDDVFSMMKVSAESRELVDRWKILPAHYILATPPARIANDLLRLAQLKQGDIDIESHFEGETGTVEYRVFTHESTASGCFHKVAGVLTLRRMEILTAQVSTNGDGSIIDAYRVRDLDHDGIVPEFRRLEVCDAIRRTLRGEIDLEASLSREQRFVTRGNTGPVSDLEARVVVDNETSDKYTIIDVFAHDRRGLLYLITRTIYQLKLSVVLARISTHFDQVVDVFYVQDENGSRIRDGGRLTAIRESLLEVLRG